MRLCSRSCMGRWECTAAECPVGDGCEHDNIT